MQKLELTSMFGGHHISTPLVDPFSSLRWSKTIWSIRALRRSVRATVEARPDWIGPIRPLHGDPIPAKLEGPYRLD